MRHITDGLLDPTLPASQRIHSLWHEYEKGQTREARFVKDLDRIEMALQASEYEKGGPACASIASASLTKARPIAQGHKGMQTFFNSSIPKIQHPEVQSWAREL